ncbi:endosomal membrane protein EMP70, putative [Ixodes scapularis]|uniref:Transmembrane 9 superfamily member n=1 Tax=Ixodes scapularis TaxID=6945 RepID=B7PXL9_IXOSC|nr:endosomal membrane protein EMP70, putative [Ixodes scapularis]|eukprot:XP_002401275.1 endosomal membrane protein EMP70, putative [Ixodes scapularis]
MQVMLYVNKVGPYFNPHETYHYYQLPVCRPNKIVARSLTLGEVLDGDRMAESLYELDFKVPVEKKVLCTVHLSEDEFKKLKVAIEDLYYFEFVIDGLRLWGFIGHLEEGGLIPHKHKLYLWTHLTFNIEYNGGRVMSANVTVTDGTALLLNDLVAPLDITHTYSVRWLPTNRRVNKLWSPFLSAVVQIHWLSVLNSTVLIVLLLGFIGIILARVLRNDFARYNAMDSKAEMDVEEYGWKIIHSDVFRFPAYKNLLCAILGVGTQFLCIAAGVLLMALLSLFNVHNHGSMNTAICVLYALTSCIAGFVSSKMYRQMGGTSWVLNVNLVSCLFFAPLFVVWSIQNSTAWIYNSTQALPATTVVLLFLIWVCCGYPLTLMGGILGKNWAGPFEAPCRAKLIARGVPPVPWYHSLPVHCFVGGFLPFSAISVELYYIFSTVWGREHYTLYGILLLVAIILLSVTASISVALTYFQLSAEDYHWWWRSVCTGGSTGLFVFLYALFFYFFRSNMGGALQAVEFYGYTILTAYIFFLTLGTVSFFSAYRFVRYLYTSIKTD